MVTHWVNHWDCLPGNETHFTKGMLRQPMTRDKIRENTPTIFIKKNKETRKPEKAWEGSVYGFRVGKDRIYFKVKIDREIPIPPEYSEYPEGWYVIGLEEEIPLEAVYYPPFFYILNTSKNYDEFERYTYSLLKLLGIHQIIKYEKQKGQPDGFFKFGNLAVIYDATLESTFEKTKETQINNYCSQLKAGSLTHKNKTIDLSHCNKQIWIITRGSSRTIKTIDNIIVKEVPISKIIQICLRRIEEEIDEAKLEDILKNI